MDSALRGTSQANVDLGVFQGKKATKGIYTQESIGYRVVTWEAPSAHSGSVAVFYHTEEHLSVEALHLYGVNIINFQLALGDQQWYIMGCYLSPENSLTIEDVVVTISQCPRGAALLVGGYFNTDLAVPEGKAWEEYIAAAMDAAGLEYLSVYFLPRCTPWLRDGRTWCMGRGGREVRSWTDYILGTDRCLLQNIAVRDAQHNTDHCLVLVFLCRAATTLQLRYLGKCTCFPVNLRSTLYGIDRLFAEIREAVTKPPWWERLRQEWTSPETWRLIYARIAKLWIRDQRNSRGIIYRIKVILQEDRRQRAAEAGSAVEYLLTSDPPFIQEAWIRMQGGYRDAVDCPPPPSRVAITTMTADWVVLYRNVPTPRKKITVGVQPFPVEESIP